MASRYSRPCCPAKSAGRTERIQRTHRAAVSVKAIKADWIPWLIYRRQVNVAEAEIATEASVWQDCRSHRIAKTEIDRKTSLSKRATFAAVASCCTRAACLPNDRLKMASYWALLLVTLGSQGNRRTSPFWRVVLSLNTVQSLTDEGK